MPRYGSGPTRGGSTAGKRHRIPPVGSNSQFKVGLLVNPIQLFACPVYPDSRSSASV